MALTSTFDLRAYYSYYKGPQTQELRYVGALKHGAWIAAAFEVLI
jgi:hypothetical protein